jgi:tRNA threonylcarbamoyladenosine biosynthesis protein TsaB
MLLAIDTATRLAGIALYGGENGLIAEHSWHSANRHTVELMPRVAEMLAQAGAAQSDLTAVAVALGPGSFTGLRVGLAAAKGMALANDLILLGVPTLDIVAYPHSRQPLPVIGLVQAGRGRVCWAVYEHGPAGWSAKAPAGLSEIPALADMIRRPTLIAGELAARDREQLVRLSGGRAVLLPPALASRRPGCLAEIGWSRYAVGERDDVASLSPIYMHEPSK